MSYHDRVREMYEQAMENVSSKVEHAKDKIEKVAAELNVIEMSEDEWRALDELVTEALVSLDRIVD